MIIEPIEFNVRMTIEELNKYCMNDVLLTEKIYLKYLELFKK